ncbi:MAG TPA: hypothetical protein VKR32_11460 [Puia sp.]|nr:hypothetical protein [Puia sp.]
MINKFQQPSFDALFGDYRLRSEEAINKIDFNKMAEVAKKELSELKIEDLEVIGFKKQHDTEFDALYAMENLDRLKLYLTIEDHVYNLRGYQLRLIKEIKSTPELIKETLLDWKLKLR